MQVTLWNGVTDSFSLGLLKYKKNTKYCSPTGYAISSYFVGDVVILSLLFGICGKKGWADKQVRTTRRKNIDTIFISLWITDLLSTAHRRKLRRQV